MDELAGGSMTEKEFLVDAVAQFLQTSEWHEAVTQFFTAHAAKFQKDSTETDDEKQSKGVGYSMDQFDVFTQFKELVERLLEGLMQSLGCSGEDLVEMLQLSLQNGPTGERRFLIKTLLSFEEYEDFHARISEFVSQQAHQATGGGDDESTVMSEWYTQLAVAQSLIDAHNQGLLDENEESFLPWAEALVDMSQTSQMSANAREEEYVAEEKETTETVEEKAVMNVEVDGRMEQLEYNLIKERLKVDLLVAQRIAEANAAMKKEMLHLSAAEVEQSEELEAKSAEQNLDALFSQLETVRDRLKVVKAHCFEFKNVNQEAMDQLYLFLKEKVHYQQDLVSQEKEISNFIFSLIELNDAPLIPLLLEWLLLESEGLRIQYQVQEQLGQAPPPTTESDGDESGFWTQSWDENAQAFFYFHSITGESVWEPPSVGFYDANQEYQTPEPRPDLDPADSAQQESFEGPSSEFSEAASVLGQAASDLDEKIADNKLTNPGEVFEMEKVLAKISREHDEERKRLELVFEVEKARQKEELRRRKEKKRREKHLKKKKRDERRGDASDANEGDDANGEKLTSSESVSALPPIAQRPTLASEAKAEAKDDTGLLGIQIPGRGRLDLAHLLSESHAKRQLEKHGLTISQIPTAQALLNPMSLRYLTDTLAKKNPDGWTEKSPTSARPAQPTELVVDDADEKD